jgi:hypothetical protein
MRNDQEIPAVIEDVSHIGLNVAIAVVLGGKQIT